MRVYLTILFYATPLFIFAQWDISSYPSDIYYFNQAIEFLDSNSVIATDVGGVYLSNDKGKSFSKRSNRTFSFSIFQFFSDSLLFNSAAPNSITSGLSYSKDTGSTFIDFPLLSSNGDTFADGEVFLYNFFPNGKAFVFDKLKERYRLLKSENYGRTWVELDSGRIVGPKLLKATSGWNHTVYKFDSILFRMDASSKFLIKAISYGDSIVLVPLSEKLEESILHVAFSNSKEGLAIAPGSGNVFRTEDAGLSFQKLNFPPKPFSRIDFVKGNSLANGFYIVGTGDFNGSFASFDNGSSWISIGDVFSYISLRFHSIKFGISCAPVNGERIRYFTGLPFNSVPHQKLGQLNVELFPNPAQSHFRIQGAEILSKITVSILDIHGKLIYKSLQSIQTDWVVPVDFLSPGLYLICLESENKLPSYKRLIVE